MLMATTGEAMIPSAAFSTAPGERRPRASRPGRR